MMARGCEEEVIWRDEEKCNLIILAAKNIK